MKKEEQIEARLYDLIENFDFDSLPETEKEFVIKNFSEEKYKSMRFTITDTKDLFSKFPLEEKKYRQFSLQRVANYPVELYKIVAAILVLFGIGFPVSNWQASKKSDLIAMVDTVYVERTDTIFLENSNTVEKTKIVQDKNYQAENVEIFSTEMPERYFQKTDCSKEICPNDIQKLSTIGSKNSFSEDKALTEFIVSIH